MLTDTETMESRADDQQRSREEDLLGQKDCDRQVPRGRVV